MVRGVCVLTVFGNRCESNCQTIISGQSGDHSGLNSGMPKCSQKENALE